MKLRYLAALSLGMNVACQGSEPVAGSRVSEPSAETTPSSPFESFAAVKRGAALGRAAELRVHGAFIEGSSGADGALRSRLPRVAEDAVSLSSSQQEVGVSFRLRGAARVPAKVDGERILFAGGGPRGADLLIAVHERSVEDYVRFAAPGTSSLEYEVDVSRAAGLRLVASTLELLDEAGVPRLRVSPPYVQDARGITRDATLRVDGCAYDVSPRMPQGRAIVRPSSDRCTLKVDWDDAGLSYPLIVDPRWATTDTQVVGRLHHAAAHLKAQPDANLPERVCLFGGHDGSLGKRPLKPIECYQDGVWATAGELVEARFDHTATAFLTGQVLIVGGASSDNPDDGLGSWEIYDSATSLSSGADAAHTLKFPRTRHTATLLGSGEVVVLGGGGLTPLFFSPQGDVREALGKKMVQPRFGHVTERVGGKLFVFGGSATPELDAPLDSIGFFDPMSPIESFEELSVKMNARRIGHTATYLPSVVSATRPMEERVLIVGSNRDAELFDPAHGTLRPTPKQTNLRRSNHVALPFVSKGGDAVVLLTGGDDGQPFPWDENEVYSGARGSFSEPDFRLNNERTEHSGVLLSDEHTVLLVGGRRGSGPPTPLVDMAVLFRPGEACKVGTDCVSGVCSKNVCCNSECSGGCEACTVERGADENGECKTLPSGTTCDVHDVSATAVACHEPSSCDGSSSECRLGEPSAEGAECVLEGATAHCQAGECVSTPEGGAGAGGAGAAGESPAGGEAGEAGSGGTGPANVERKPAIAWSCAYERRGAGGPGAWLFALVLLLKARGRRRGVDHAS